MILCLCRQLLSLWDWWLWSWWWAFWRRGPQWSQSVMESPPYLLEWSPDSHCECLGRSGHIAIVQVRHNLASVHFKHRVFFVFFVFNMAEQCGFLFVCLFFSLGFLVYFFRCCNSGSCIKEPLPVKSEFMWGGQQGTDKLGDKSMQYGRFRMCNRTEYNY